LAVASSFFWAIHKKDLDSALKFIDPSQQADFEKHLHAGLPSIPENAKFDIEQGAPIDGNQHAEVSIKNANIGIDLVRYRNGWWIIK
jgi:hypothetical protein